MQVADRARARWQSTRRVGRCLLALVAFDQDGFPAPAQSLTNPPQKQSPPLAQRVDDAYTRFATYVRAQNHGIREKNLLRMMLPVGVRELDLDVTWLNHMDGFGIMRGTIAHTSARAVQQPPDNAAARAAVANALGVAPAFGLRDADDLLAALG